jgi:hypothetical protein
VGTAQLAHLPPPGAQQPDGMDEHISLTELVTGGEVRPSHDTRLARDATHLVTDVLWHISQAACARRQYASLVLP